MKRGFQLSAWEAGIAPIDDEGRELSLVFRGDVAGFCEDVASQAFVGEGAENDISALSAVAVTGRLVHRVANNGVFESVFGSDESMEHLTSVDSDAEFAEWESVIFSAFIDGKHLAMHFDRGLDGPPCMVFIGFRASKHSEDCITDKFIDGAVVTKDFLTQCLEVIVEHIDDNLGIERCAGFGESAKIGKENGDGGFLASGLKAAGAGFVQQAAADFWGEVGEEVFEGPVVLFDFCLEKFVCDS